MPSPRVDKDIRLLMDKLYHIREPHIKAFLLFGSRARGEAQDRSDVDLLILHDGCGIDDPVARRRYLYGHDPSGRVCELVGKFPALPKK
ncbi:MAG: nucleotidyltransferase family protein [Candidatus Bathyarchaeia archaeon]